MDDCNIILVSATREKVMWNGLSLGAACLGAMARNKSPYNTLYIVEKPGGERLTIAEQKKLLGIKLFD